MANIFRLHFVKTECYYADVEAESHTKMNKMDFEIDESEIPF